MGYRRAQGGLLALLIILPLTVVFPPVEAETYSLTVSPQYTQERNSPGVTLPLTVTGASTILSYTFEWVVTDPSGNTKNTQKTQPSGQSSFTLVVVYPQDFGGGATIGFVGQYSVTVFQTSPPVFPSVASGNFDVGLTDKAVYSRTAAVSIKATSYNTNDDVTIDIIRGGTPAPGFPVTVKADLNGDVSYIWQTNASTPTGNHTITLTGLTTPNKVPPDSQNFILQPTTVSVAVSVPSTTLGPGQALVISVNATYPDSNILTQGTVIATISTTGFQIGSQIPLGFEQSQARWVGSYVVKDNDPTGIWLVEVSASDPYGNTGQSSPASAFVNVPVQPPQQSPLTSFWFLSVLGAAITGGLAGLVFFRRKKTTKHRLQVDLQAVGREADRVKNQEFFRSVRRQLNHMRDDSEKKDV